MRISIIGAGPAGLYTAILLKRRQPDWQVDVVEQNGPDSTFGFGVVLSDTGLARLQAADAATHRALLEKMTFTTQQIITHRETRITVKRPNKGGGAIARIDLLHVLQQAASDAGASIRYGQRIEKLSDLDTHAADIIVGADGINSVVRSGCEESFGTSRSCLTNHFAWYGLGMAFPTSALVFRNYLGGVFVAHYYPYAPDRSTVVAECDDRTWREFGMEQMDAAQRQNLFETVFAPELGGHGLISNNSTWRQFPVIRNRHSVSGNMVLLGDAETSAHYSIGSGTRIAMDDAIALAQALTQHGNDRAVSPAARLQSFALQRGPEKRRLIAASERSYLWYEDMAQWMQRHTPLQFVHAFMTRTGRVSDERLKAGYPELYAAIQSDRASHGATVNA